ncbi:MAG: hypothetical protein RO009_10290 [Pseudorhodoplanes sp.]|jgi:hypothetical protein|nr:hypothetical protein [Pseudorhodoplanes sp.]
MQIFVVGALVCAGLLIVGYYQRATVIVALIASFAFGSTAIATIESLGGASPLIFTVFAALLLVSIPLRRHALHDLGVALTRSGAPWIIGSLILYTTLGAIILPRLFAGQTTAFVPSRVSGEVFELPLAPVSGNITQTGYFSLGALVFLALSILLTRRNKLQMIRRGFFTLCVLHVALGFVDLTGKLIGAGDVLMPVRSASYALATNVEEAGFFRIAGGYSEASAFGGVALACLAFTSTYWRRTRSFLAFALSIALIVLLALSTSTTAYVGLTIISLPLVASIIRSILVGRLSGEDLILVALVSLCVTIALAIYLYNSEVFAPVIKLFEATILNKSSSLSGQERAYWNLKSLQSLFDTAGLGIGLGSSRSSSWIISVLSQFGAIGAFLMAALVVDLMRGLGQKSARSDLEIVAIHDGVRAFALLWLMAAAIAGGGADPGLLFFVSLATVIACRQQVSRGHVTSTGTS